MNIIKKQREQLGLTQEELAKKTGLSLRTIQRLESGTSIPKGFSLRALSNLFGIEPVDLQMDFEFKRKQLEKDKLSIIYINLASIAFFIFPLGNIILPMIIWSKRKSSDLVNDAGRRIINFQILWTIILFASLIISPFIDPISEEAFPLILITLFVGLLVNFSVVLFTASKIYRNNFNFLNFKFRII